MRNTKKIIGDGFFSMLYPKVFHWSDQIQNSHKSLCESIDLRGISFFRSDRLKSKINTVDKLLRETQLLFVNVSEPTHCEEILALEHYYRDNDRVLFFSDIVPNFPSVKFKTSISWFVQPVNIYNGTLGRAMMDRLSTGFCRRMVFDCLLGSQRPHRDIIARYHENSDVKHKIFFSYFKNRSLVNWKNQNFWQDISFLEDHLDPVFPSRDRFRLKSSKQREVCVIRDQLLPIDIYNETYYSIVAETTDHNQYNQYTEKVAKPLFSGRPFVIFAGQHYLKNLRSLGFKTFSSVIDESYDSVPDRESRFALAWQQVEKLCRQDHKKVYQTLQTVLEHNQKHFLETNWHSAILDNLPDWCNLKIGK